METKRYIIQNKEYTEQQLIDIINFYDDYHYNSLLPDELIYKILVFLDVENYRNLFMINKKYKKLSKNSDFWKSKFEEGDLPCLINIKHHNFKSIIVEYYKIKKAFDISNKLVDYVLSKKKSYFKDFYIIDNINISNLNWLPRDLVDIIDKTKNDMDISLTFNIEKLILYYEYTPIDPVTGNETDDYQILDFELTKHEFVQYMTKLFYFIPNYVIENYAEREIYLEYDLMNDLTYIRKYLPEW